METNNTEAKILELEKKVDDMTVIVRKLYRTFLWTMWITVALFVLPLIGLLFAIPTFLSSYTSQTSMLGL